MRLPLVILMSLCVAACADKPDSAASHRSDNGSDVETSTEPNASIKSANSSNWLSSVGTVPVYEQRQGDAEKGRHALLHESYVNCGLPERIFRELQSSGSVADIKKVPGRDSAMDGLPYNTNRVIGRTGIPIVSSNCLSCHGTVLFGELVIGLGNEFADFTQNPSVAVERSGALVQGEDEITEWTVFANRIAAIAPYIQTRTVGVNPAPNLTGALVAHRDVDTHAWLDEPQMLMPPTDPPPVSVPPWWRMKKKHAMFSLSEGRQDHARFMLAASMLCADSEEELDRIDAYAPDVRAYLSNIQPPAYPFDVNAELAAMGQPIYEQECASCHGGPGEASDYPNTVTDIESVQTDSRLMDVATGDYGREFAAWFNASWFGDLSVAAPAKGYIAPPLDGIWATAPFLHNGSVPSIQALLTVTDRPTHWRHIANDANDPDSYDTKNLGWRYEGVSTGSASAADPRVYDTSLEGYGNQGHSYGDSLSERDKNALIEYLKTF